MNSIRCSRATTALVFGAVLLAAVGTVSAVAVDGLPAESQVGEEVTVSHTIEDPFTDAPNQWTLEGTTELEDVRWTVTVKRAGSQVSQQTYTDQSFEHSLAMDNGGDEVVVELDGTTPPIANYTYAPEERYVAVSLDRTTGDNADSLVNESAHHYTNQSEAARTAIENAQAAIDEAGGHQEAETTLERAKAFYEGEQFQDATGAAEDAEQQAESAHQSQQTTRTLLLVGGAVAVLLLLGGGGYYWLTNKDDYTKL